MSLSCSPEECAALHNQLLHKITQHVSSIILQLGLVEETLDIAPDLALVPNIEQTPLYRFLSLCDTYTGPQGRDTLPLTPQAAQPHAQDFFSEFLQSDGDHSFLILLYPFHVGPGRGRDQDAGLLLDPASFRAHWHFLPTSGNNRLEPARHWEPLDRILRRWLALWDHGKYYWDEELQYPRIRPWVAERDLVESLGAWDELLACIANRLPSSPSRQFEWKPPLDKALLSQFRMSPFTVEFLSRAKRPPFALVAPGITVFSNESLSAVYASESTKSWRRKWTENAEPDEWPSLLLPTKDGRPVSSDGLVDERFDKDWGVGKLTVNRMPGLYIDAAAEDADSVFFVTKLGRTGLFDFSRRCPWGPGRKPRLSEVLRKWTRLIETGVWSVGEEGVVTGDEWFQTEDLSQDTMLDWTEDVEQF